MPRRHQPGSPVVPLREVADRLGVPLDESVREAARRFPLRFPRDYLETVAGFTGAGVTLTEERDLWDMPIVLILILVLLGAEWGIRRVRGFV